MAKRAASKKRYIVSAPAKLHDARRILGLPIIAHTGRVNFYARCMGGKLKAAQTVAGAQDIMRSTANITGCNGVPEGKPREWTRKDGVKKTAPRRKVTA